VAFFAPVTDLMVSLPSLRFPVIVAPPPANLCRKEGGISYLIITELKGSCYAERARALLLVNEGDILDLVPTTIVLSIAM
jgi:hypothetical protein